MPAFLPLPKCQCLYVTPQSSPSPVFRPSNSRYSPIHSKLNVMFLLAEETDTMQTRHKREKIARVASTDSDYSHGSNTAYSVDSGIADCDPVEFVVDEKSFDEVKKLIRKGRWPITHEIRKQLWTMLCYDKNYDSMKAVFQRNMQDENSSGRACRPIFLNEDGTVINNFELNEEGAVKLLKLLGMIENDHPTMNSSPMLYPLCSLFLHYMSDCETYACAEFLLKKRKHPTVRSPAVPYHPAFDSPHIYIEHLHKSAPLGFLTKTSREWYASAHTILALVKKHKASSYQLLKRRCNCSDDEVLVETVRDWLTWIFAGLPLPHVIRVVDCFLVEGQKFVIRAGIAIVYIWAKASKNRPADHFDGKSGEERITAVKEELHNTAKQMEISTDTFIETCVRIKNLKSAIIQRFQSDFEKKVQSEVERREKQKRPTRIIVPLYTDVFQSSILDSEAAAYIMQYLPARLQLSTPNLIFKLSKDGASFTHMWSKIDLAEQSLIIIRTTKGDVFGAYCSACWAERNDRKERTKSKYFGTGESFVFKVESVDSNMPIIYQWVGNNNEQPDNCPQMFQAANDRLIVIGSGDGDAIRISEELTHGMTGRCKTFDSPPLVEGRAFDIHELEVFEVCA